MDRALAMGHKPTDAEVKRLHCRPDFIKQEVGADNMEHVDASNSENSSEAMTIKEEELVDSELERVKVKEELIKCNQEPQVSLEVDSSTFTFKREVDEVCGEKCSAHAESKDKLRKSSYDSCNTSTSHPRSAGASLGCADFLKLDLSDANSDVEVKRSGCRTKRFYCDLCDYTADQRYCLQRHLKHKHKLGVILKCEFCDYASAVRFNLRRHLAYKHGIGKVLACQKCDYSCTVERKLKLHQAIKHGLGKILTCDECNYSSDITTNFKIHQLMKHGIGKLLTCELCDYSCVRRANLQRHLISKHGVGKLLECQLCDYSCVANSDLQRHLARKHRLQKVFKCELCEYSSTDSRNLKRHGSSKHGQRG